MGRALRWYRFFFSYDIHTVMDPAGRARLYWLVCLPVRVGIAIAVVALSRLHPGALPLLGLLLLLPTVGFAVQSVLGGRERGAFGGPAWWARARPAHAALYAASSALCFWGKGTAAGLALLADAGLGVALGVALQPRA